MKALFFLRSFEPRHCRARQGRLDESKAKGKKGKGKGKGKGKRPEFRCTDLWFDMYSSAELEFVICFFVFCVCVCELRAVVQHTLPTSIHTLGSLVFVEVGCSVQVLLLVVVYADPWLPGTNRLYAWTNHVPHYLRTLQCPK